VFGLIDGPPTTRKWLTHLRPDQAASVRAARPELPAELDDVIARSMSKRPEERQETATQLIADAVAAVRGLAHASELAAPPPRPSRRGSSSLPGQTTDPSTRRTGATAPTLLAEGPRRSEPVRPADPPNSRARRRRRTAGAVVFTAVGLAVVVGSFFVGHSGAQGAVATRSLAAAGVSVRVPRDWRTIPGPLPIQDLLGVPGAAAGPPGVHDAGVLVGRTPAFGYDLLPAIFHHWVAHSLSGRRGRTSAGLEGLLYTNLFSQAGAGQHIGLFVAPTTDRDAVVACFAPTQGPDHGVMAECPRVIASLVLERFDPGRQLLRAARHGDRRDEHDGLERGPQWRQRDRGGARRRA
jgi:hypothetical protein